MDLQFTAVFRKVPEGYIGFVEELPGANTQGATLEEARANLHEAVALILGLKRRDLIRHLEQHDCQLLREGGNHSIYVNPRSPKDLECAAAQRNQQRFGEEDLQGSSGAATRRLASCRSAASGALSRSDSVCCVRAARQLQRLVRQRVHQAASAVK